MQIRSFLLLLTLQVIVDVANGQEYSDSSRIEKGKLDSLYILETEGRKGRDKVLHAEPLYIDLIRDLGARKGEKEWNIGVGLTDNRQYDQYTALVEYEFAPADRLGLEVELPFSFYFPADSGVGRPDIPGSKLNSLKLAAQYSFFVSEKISTSVAVGYIHEFEMVQFSRYGKGSLWAGSVYNPFFVVAKRWRDRFHTLVYTGPVFERVNGSKLDIYQLNTSLHYMIPGTRNFAGVEVNQEFYSGRVQTVFRPQMRLVISDRLMLGIVSGIPVSRRNERFSSFLRLIYEPGHASKHTTAHKLHQSNPAVP
jgi:hypothetical protein